MELQKCPEQFRPRIPDASAQFPSVFIYIDSPFGITASIQGKLVAFDPNIIFLRINLPNEIIQYDASAKPIHDQVLELFDAYPILKEAYFAYFYPNSFIALKWSAISPSPYESIPDFYTYHSLNVAATGKQDSHAEITNFYMQTGFSGITNQYKTAFQVSFLIRHQIKHPYQWPSQFDNICRLLQIKLCNIRDLRASEYFRYVKEYFREQKSAHEGRSSFDTALQLFVNSLYCRYLRTQISRNYQERSVSSSRQKLLCTLPFWQGRKNAYFKDCYFLESVIESDARNAVRELYIRTLTFLQQISPRYYMNYALFEQDDEIYKSLCDTKLSMFSPRTINSKQLLFINEALDLSKCDLKRAVDKATQLLDYAIVYVLADPRDRLSNQFSGGAGDIYEIIADLQENAGEYGLEKDEYERMFVTSHYCADVHEVALAGLSGQFRNWAPLETIGWFQSGFEGYKEAIRRRLGHLWGVEQEIVVKTLDYGKKKWELS